MLIPIPSRILVAREPVDLRKSIDGLAAVCELVLRERPLDGTLFLFTNRRRDSLKALIWTYGGFTMLYKKLEQGRFRCGPRCRRTAGPSPVPSWRPSSRVST